MSAQYRVPDGILDRTIGDELLVHRFDTDEVFVLNEDAKVVFEAVKQAGEHEQVRAFVASRVFGDTVEIYEAVDRTLGQMVAEGLILETEHPST
jgi:hypothetical protein